MTEFREYPKIITLPDRARKTVHSAAEEALALGANPAPFEVEIPASEPLSQADEQEPAVPAKRGPGRPRKS